MYCSASATLAMTSACLIVVIIQTCGNRGRDFNIAGFGAKSLRPGGLQ
jgi:hypothetical protein